MKKRSKKIQLPKAPILKAFIFSPTRSFVMQLYIDLQDKRIVTKEIFLEAKRQDIYNIYHLTLMEPVSVVFDYEISASKLRKACCWTRK